MKKILLFVVVMLVMLFVIDVNVVEATDVVETVVSNTNVAVVYGDTLSALAVQYNTTVDTLMAINTYITNADVIYAGNTIVVPVYNTTITVVEGSTSVVLDMVAVHMVVKVLVYMAMVVAVVAMVSISAHMVVRAYTYMVNVYNTMLVAVVASVYEAMVLDMAVVYTVLLANNKVVFSTYAKAMALVTMDTLAQASIIAQHIGVVSDGDIAMSIVEGALVVDPGYIDPTPIGKPLSKKVKRKKSRKNKFINRF